MDTSRAFLKRSALVVAGALVFVTAVAYFCWPAPNTVARSRVRAVLHSSASPQQHLEELEPFVKIGDNISKVHNCLSPTPNAQNTIERPTEWALGLGDANLVLAVHANGRVVGIGRHLYGVDDGTIWLSAPQW